MVFIQRRPNDVQFSIERLFASIRQALSADVCWRVHISPRLSTGFLPRIRNLAAARRAAAGRVAHITGDVHYLALGLPRGSFVLTIHDCAVLSRLRGWRRELVRRLWFVEPVRRAAVVTTISEATRTELVRWLPRTLHGKIRVVPDCVAPEFVPAPKIFNAASPVFLQVGTKHPKNLERVIEAVQGFGCSLSIIGELSAEQRVRLDEANIQFIEHGSVSDEDLVTAYRESDALIFVSLIEGFGLPIVEAQATGRPVITSNRSAMPETAGDGALLADPEDVESIRTVVLRLIRNDALRASIVERGYENVKRFAAREVAAQYEAIYHEIAATQ